MTKVINVCQCIDAFAPFETQWDFDNSGFQVGRRDQEVTKILVSLDITREVVEEAAQLGAQLIVAHHPIIFHPVKSVIDRTPTGEILLALIENKIAAICAHTNLDAARGGVNDCLAKALELTEIGQLCQAGVDAQGRPYGIGRVGTVHRPGLSAREYAAFVKERLNAANVRFVGGGKPVQRVAVGGGACGSMLEDVVAQGCDTFVTADLKYNQFLDAKALGLNLLDAGHFPTENVVCGPMVRWLSEAFPKVEVRLSEVHREVYKSV
ncbi:MAG: Nif3-like dinuclear metal center hexameric protein [Lawsonibacter sp.]|jgi:dinuclear metal center YbgI/SA1388 family protein|nr:Nif3-like dinuclear metal center hexameric protein [Lawsonibacter sp.]